MSAASPYRSAKAGPAAIDWLGAITALRALPTPWLVDGKECDRPTDWAIVRSLETLSWARSRGLAVTEIDADVCGGVAVWLAGSGRRVWVAHMNSGAESVVASCECGVDWSAVLTVSAWDRAEAFLLGKETP